VNVKVGQWNYVVWEVSDRPMTDIQSVGVYFGLSGREPNADKFLFYMDDFELQVAEPEYCEGWAVWPGRISFSHTGYQTGFSKQAIASDLEADSIELLGTDDKVVHQGDVQKVTSRLGKFQLMDFSHFDTPGEYRIRAGDVTTRPFKIAQRLWDDTIKKVINFYYNERCGFALEGIHEKCHSDVFCEHDGKRIRAGGSWHDAGDLTLPSIRCAESAYAMFDLYEQLQSRGNEELAKLVLEEARFGIDWFLKNTFRDGYRCFGGVLRFYSDGIDDNYDDVYFEAEKDAPFDFLYYAALEAKAHQVLKEIDPEKAALCLELAKEDFGYGFPQIDSVKPSPTNQRYLTVHGMGIMAAVDLYEATGQESYLEKAAALAPRILQCQQTRVIDGLTTPLVGYFYNSPRRENIRNFNHYSQDPYTLLPFIRLCESLPDHADWIKWYNSVVLRTEYYLKSMCQFTAPYQYIPNGIFSETYWSQSRYPEIVDFLHEGVDIGADHFLRVFSAQINWQFRGNTGTALAQTKCMSAASVFRNNAALMDLVQKQLQWTVGQNPFSQSIMYGEGYDYTPYYTPQIGDAVGALPVGIKAKFTRDVPYWSPTSTWNYKEVWIHPTACWLWVMADIVQPDLQTGEEPQVALDWHVDESGQVTIAAKAADKGEHRYELMLSNLQLEPSQSEPILRGEHQDELIWHAKVIDSASPWTAVVVVDGDKSHRGEATDWAK